jgi:hypothetical protein
MHLLHAGAPAQRPNLAQPRRSFSAEGFLNRATPAFPGTFGWCPFI